MKLTPAVRPRSVRGQVLAALYVGFFLGGMTGILLMWWANRVDTTTTFEKQHALPSRTTADAPTSVTLEHDARVAPGGEVVVAVRTGFALPRDAWVGIIPSDVPHGDEVENDQHDLSYQYMEGRSRATMIFRAPDTPGRYDLRLHSTDSRGVELAHATFHVAGY